jgi:hypothetical protein
VVVALIVCMLLPGPVRETAASTPAGSPETVTATEPVADVAHAPPPSGGGGVPEEPDPPHAGSTNREKARTGENELLAILANVSRSRRGEQDRALDAEHGYVQVHVHVHVWPSTCPCTSRVDEHGGPSRETGTMARTLLLATVLGPACS